MSGERTDYERPPIVLPEDPPPYAAPAHWSELLRSIHLELEADETQAIGRYLALLAFANERMNLMSVRDMDEAWSRHILDSLTLVPFIAQADSGGEAANHATSVIDVGSGGGLPGVPLAIAMPEVQFTLLEATGKKAAFLQQVIARLALANVTVVNQRAEQFGQERNQERNRDRPRDHPGDHHEGQDWGRERFDIAIARAVGPLPVLLELTIPLLRVGGHVLAIKGAKAAEEVDSAREALLALHGRVIDQHQTPTGVVCIIEKHNKTPRIYPRRPGEPKRAPLGGA